MAADSWRSAWTAALDTLEADVTAVEALLRDEHLLRDLPAADAWAPPDGLGPLPLDLRPRADEILSRQITAAKKLSVAMTATRRQEAFANKVQTGHSGPLRPSYVDVAM